MRNGWGGRLCNVGRAYLFFLYSLIGKKKNFAGATGPPSHYVAPPLVKGDAKIVISALKDGIISYPEFGHIIQDSLVISLM